MAGQPITRKRKAKLKMLGPEGEEQILLWLATGMPTRQIALQLGLGPHGSRALYQWRDENDVRKAAWQQALEYRADYLAEESLELADGVLEDTDAIRKAELQIKVRQWLASVSNPERYGKDAGRKATVHIEHLHLTAVEAFNAEKQAAAIKRIQESAVPLAEYEILDDEDEYEGSQDENDRPQLEYGGLL